MKDYSIGTPLVPITDNRQY